LGDSLGGVWPIWQDGIQVKKNLQKEGGFGKWGKREMALESGKSQRELLGTFKQGFPNG